MYSALHNVSSRESALSAPLLFSLWYSSDHTATEDGSRTYQSTTD
jgi:hypothetical protein